MVKHDVKLWNSETDFHLIEELSKFFENLHIYLNKETRSQTPSHRTDSKLYRMKKVYEKLFPWTQRGGYMKTYRRYNKSKLLKKTAIPLTGLRGVWASIKPNAGFIMKLKPYLPVGDTIDPRKIPSFIKLVSSISGFSISTIKNRIQAYKIVSQGLINEVSIRQYCAGAISYSSVLKVYEKERRIKVGDNRCQSN